MAIVPQWCGADETILLVNFNACDLTTWADYHRIIDNTYQIAASKAELVFLVIDATDTPMPGGNPMPHFRRKLREKPKNIRAVITIVDEKYTAIILNMFMKLVRFPHIYAVSTMDEAHQIIKDLDTNTT